MIEGDTHGSGVFSLLGLHGIGIVKSAATVAAIDLIHGLLEGMATDLCGVGKEGGGVALAVLQAGANDTHLRRIWHIFGSIIPQSVQKSPYGDIVLSGKTTALRLPAQLKPNLTCTSKWPVK